MRMHSDPNPASQFPKEQRLPIGANTASTVTFVLRGKVALIHDSVAAAGDVTLHEASTGRVIGLMSLTEGGNAKTTARTTSEITCVQLTIEQFKTVVEQRPTTSLLAAVLMIRSLDMRLRRADELHVEHVQLSAELEKERAQLATALTNLEEARHPASLPRAFGLSRFPRGGNRT